MWWWDGSRWQPSTPATAGKPPRAPTAPWGWVGIGCLSLLLVTAVPLAWTWGRLTHDPRFEVGFGRGFAQTYLEQRQTGLTQLDADSAALEACERTSNQPCYVAADTLGRGAAAESDTVSGEAGLFYFPACLKPPALAETEHLAQVTGAASTVRTFAPSASAVVAQQLGLLRSALAAVAADVAAARSCG